MLDNSINPIEFFSIILLLLLSSACRDYHITTKINTDGTCERIIRIDSDTHENILKELPFFIDSTWEKKLEKSPKDTTHQVIIFSKIFPDKPDESDNIVEPIRLFRGSEEVDKLRISSPEIFKSKFGSSKKSEL